VTFVLLAGLWITRSGIGVVPGWSAEQGARGPSLLVGGGGGGVLDTMGTLCAVGWPGKPPPSFYPGRSPASPSHKATAAGREGKEGPNDHPPSPGVGLFLRRRRRRPGTLLPPATRRCVDDSTVAMALTLPLFLLPRKVRPDPADSFLNCTTLNCFVLSMCTSWLIIGGGRATLP